QADIERAVGACWWRRASGGTSVVAVRMHVDLFVRYGMKCSGGCECFWIGVVFGVHGGASATAAEPMRDVLDDREADGDEKDSEEGGEDHAADDDCAEDLAGDAAGAGGDPKRNAAEDEGKGRHDDGTEAETGGAECGVGDGLALFVVADGELDDEDGVLRGKADEHDEADGGEDVVFKRAHGEGEVGAEDGDGRGEQDAEGKRPAFVERGEDEESNEDGEAEDDPGGDTLLGGLFLV